MLSIISFFWLLFFDYHMVDASLIDSIMSLCLSVILYMCSSRSYRLFSLSINANKSHFSIVSLSLVIHLILFSVFCLSICWYSSSFSWINFSIYDFIYRIRSDYSKLFVIASLYIMFHLFSIFSFFILSFGFCRYSYISLLALSSFILLLRSFSFLLIFSSLRCRYCVFYPFIFYCMAWINASLSLNMVLFFL